MLLQGILLRFQVKKILGNKNIHAWKRTTLSFRARVPTVQEVWRQKGVPADNRESRESGETLRWFFLKCNKNNWHILSIYDVPSTILTAFIKVNSCNPYNYPCRWVLLLYPFFRWEHWGLERLSACLRLYSMEIANRGRSTWEHFFKAPCFTREPWQMDCWPHRYPSEWYSYWGAGDVGVGLLSWRDKALAALLGRAEAWSSLRFLH